jgi:hypothetical protein
MKLATVSNLSHLTLQMYLEHLLCASCLCLYTKPEDGVSTKTYSSMVTQQIQLFDSAFY